MLAKYLPFLITLGFSAFLATAMLLLSRFIGWRNSNRKGQEAEPFECGNMPSGYASEAQFSVKFYLTALLFLIFDMETIFVLLWAVGFSDFQAGGIALLAFWQMMMFIGVLAVGYVYVWRRGGFSWR